MSDINEGQKADSKNLSEIDYLKKIRSKNRMRIFGSSSDFSQLRLVWDFGVKCMSLGRR